MAASKGKANPAQVNAILKQSSTSYVVPQQ